MTEKRIRKVKNKIQAIQATRATNNVQWMKILELAIIYAPPNEILSALKNVDKHDTKINVDFMELVSILERAEDDKN